RRGGQQAGERPSLAARTRGTSADRRVAKAWALGRSMADTGLRSLEPLQWTRREADAIAARLPAEQVVLALGPDASRATAMGPEVARARIIHFASHALLGVKR